MTAVLAAGATPLVSLGMASESTQPQVQARVDYKGGAELASDGTYVYASQGGKDGALRVVAGRSGRVAGFLKCAVTGQYQHNDVAVLRRGLIVLAAEKQACAKNVAVVDVSEPAKPRVIGSVDAESVHTVAVHPDGRHIYVNDGGGFTQTSPLGKIVDTINPRKPEVVAAFPRTPLGCHDMSFLEQADRVFAYCAGGLGGGVYVWDATEPAAPVQIGLLPLPALEFTHWARPSPDGKLLLISDEAVVVHTCNGTSVPGSITIADLTVPEAPVVVGRISPPRGAAPVGGIAVDQEFVYGCTSHQFDLIPGTRTGVFSWYRGGISVVDYTDPLAPKEIAFHNPPNGQAFDAIWSHGRVWVNDGRLGLTKLRVPGL
jgi:hypothetical protein